MLVRETCYSLTTPTRFLRLTPALIQTLDLLAEGLSNKEIARRSGRAPGTVRNYLRLSYEILQVSNRTKAALWWREHREEVRP